MDLNDIPSRFESPICADYTRRTVSISMRDGIKLHTEILVPEGAKNAGMILERTPYSAAKISRLRGIPRGSLQLYPVHGELLDAGYIIVLQDVRGKHQSEGTYGMNLPLRGPLNSLPADYATDAFDTIDWLTTNVDESNGAVATIGLSYDGYTALLSLVDSHPALKACIPINPMVDGWLGDDWFNNGAFRQQLTAPYAYTQTSSKTGEQAFPEVNFDDYETYMDAGSAGELGRRFGLDRLPFWQRLCAHPTYDEFWQDQAVDNILRGRPLSVPTLHVHSQWDAEDIHGSIAVFMALDELKANRSKNHLVIGPWSHVGPCFHDGYRLGQICFASQTAVTFRRDILEPFLREHLLGQPPQKKAPRVRRFESGTNRWLEHESWPPTKREDATVFLSGSYALSSEPPVSTETFDEFVSDPAKPVTYLPRPIRPKSAADSSYESWLIADQRFADSRSDVLTYTGQALSESLHLAGAPSVELYAATTGSDADWIVKLIDVFPGQHPGQIDLGGYQMPIAMGIIRGRYRNSFAQPEPIEPDECAAYRFSLPHVSHCVLPGHRLMVQVQSTWFPLFDRNPQRYVDNIFEATSDDYQKSVHRVFRQPGAASKLDLPIVFHPGR